MSEADIIAATPAPRTVATLTSDLRSLGVASGDVLICHTSMRAIGWVAGGPAAVIDALVAAIGESGTLVMPAQSGDLSDPEQWQNPPVPAHWIATIRAEGRAYDPATTPTRGMGVVAELFRSWPGAQRSGHPTLSFAARGPEADRILAAQPLDDAMGPDGPLGALHRLDAKILLLGTDYESCTSLHLAERLAAPDAPREETGAAVRREGRTEWVSFSAPELRDGDELASAGVAFEVNGPLHRGMIGSAQSRLMPMRALVDFATEFWKKSG